QSAHRSGELQFQAAAGRRRRRARALRRHVTPGFRRAWLLATWLVALLIVAGSLAPQDLVAPAGYGDKFNHFIAYFVLTVMAAGVAETSALRRICAYVFLLGLTLEIAQGTLTTDRSADWLDLLSNATGIIAAWWLMARGGDRWGRHRPGWGSCR